VPTLFSEWCVCVSLNELDGAQKQYFTKHTDIKLPKYPSLTIARVKWAGHCVWVKHLQWEEVVQAPVYGRLFFFTETFLSQTFHSSVFKPSKYAECHLVSIKKLGSFGWSSCCGLCHNRGRLRFFGYAIGPWFSTPRSNFWFHLEKK